MAWVMKQDGSYVWEDDSSVATLSPESITNPTVSPVKEEIDSLPYGQGGFTTGQNLVVPTVGEGSPPEDTLSTDVGNQYAEWVAAGGSGDWEEFRQHAQRLGSPDPGQYSPEKTPGIELDPNANQAPVVTPPDPTLVPTVPTTGSATVEPTVEEKPPAISPLPAATSTPTPTTTSPTTEPLTLDETKRHIFYLRPDGTIVYVKPGGRSLPNTTPVAYTPAEARKMGWKGTPQGAAQASPTPSPGAPTTAVATPTSQSTPSTVRTMYENADGTVTATPKDQSSTAVQVTRPQAAKAGATGPTLEQLTVDRTPVTATSMGVGRFVNDNPVTAAAKLTLESQGIDTSSPQAQTMVQEYAKQVTTELQGYGPRADQTLNTIAQLAWYRQTGGQQGAPENAPKDYIESWKGAWRTGQLVPLGPSLDQALIDQKIAPPSVHEIINAAMQPKSGTNPAEIDKAGRAFANVQRLAQGEGAQYQNQEQYDQWYRSACSAASFAAMVNAANPNKKMTVGEAVNFLVQENLLNSNVGLTRGSDFTDISKALNKAIGAQNTVPVNMRTPEEVQKHFQNGGGAIMFTGPGTAIWGDSHIYVATGANEEGISIVDSSKANRTALSWEEWRQQTALPGMGAGAALTTRSIANPLAMGAEQAQGGALLSDRPGGGGSARAKEALTGGSRWDPSLGGKFGESEEDIRAYQDHILQDFQLPPTPAPSSQIGQDGFMRQWKPVLDQLQAETGFDAGTIMGIIVSESGWGDETARTGSNNYFGMRPNQYDRYANGKTQANFATYPDAKSSLARFIGILSHPENSNYRSAFEGRSDGNSFISGLIQGGYAPASENDQGNWRRIINDVAQRYRGL